MPWGASWRAELSQLESYCIHLWPKVLNAIVAAQAIGRLMCPSAGLVHQPTLSLLDGGSAGRRKQTQTNQQLLLQMKIIYWGVPCCLVLFLLRSVTTVIKSPPTELRVQEQQETHGSCRWGCSARAPWSHVTCSQTASAAIIRAIQHIQHQLQVSVAVCCVCWTSCYMQRMQKLIMVVGRALQGQL